MGSKKPHEPRALRGGRERKGLLRPLLENVRGFAAEIARGPQMRPKPSLPDWQADLDTLLLRAMRKEIGEADMPAINGLLRCPVKMARVVGVCLLAEVEWGRVTLQARDAVFDSLKGIRDGPDEPLADAARRAMERIVESAVSGGLDEARMAA